MQTLADRLRKEGEKKGREEGKLQTARTLIKRGINMDIIAEATGFPKKRIEKLAATVH
jgi:predicted transposase/invertase (TIGR01784 family)